MSKKKTAEILEHDATDLVRRLVAVMSQHDISESTGIDKAKISRLFAGSATIEQDGYRKLAKLAVERRVI